MKKVLKKRTGFTLVELLIVIIIIGILAGAMLLVAGSGTDKAEATKIVSDMRSIKAAALMRYADTTNWNWVKSGDIQDKVGKYMDRAMDSAKYDYDINFSSGDVVVYIEATGFLATSGIAEKLVDTGKASGLYTNKECTTELTTAADPIYMRVK